MSRLLLCLLLVLTACASDADAGNATRTPTPIPTRRVGWHTLARDLGTALGLPGQIEQVQIAVHPRDGWPAVLAVSYWNFSADPAALTVRVYDPEASAWGPTRQLDVGPSSLGGDAFHGAVLGIGVDGTVHAAWGASDTDGGIWTSSSSDAGQTWSQPTRIARGCWHVSDLVVAPDATVTVLAFCVATTRDQNGTRPALITRTPAGRWLPVQFLPVTAWEGRLVLTDTGIVGLVVPHLGGSAPRTGFILTRPLTQPGLLWHIQPVSLVPPGVLPETLGLYAWHVAGVSTGPGALFTYTGYDRASLFVLRVVEGNILPPVAVLADTTSSRERGRSLWYGAPAADAASGALVTIWGCCGSPIDPAPTHLTGAWSTDGTRWAAALQTTPPQANGLPLVDEAGRVEALTSAQVVGARSVWLAWVVDGHRVRVASVPLALLVPSADVQP